MSDFAPKILTQADLAGLTGKDREIAASALRRGLTVTQFEHSWRIRGPGVDCSATRLRELDQTNLRPPI